MALTLKPGEETFEVRPIGIRYRCPFCNEGFMEVTNDVVIFKECLSNPPGPIMRNHICNKCGKKMQLPGSYPSIQWDVIEEEDDHETESSQVPVDNEERTS